METLNQLEIDILKCVGYNTATSFAELANAFPNHKGNGEIVKTFDAESLKNLRAPRGSSEDLKNTLKSIRKTGVAIFWSGFSEEFVDAFVKLKNEGYLTTKPTGILTYVYDGTFLRANNWLPAVIDLTEKGRKTLKEVPNSGDELNF